VAKSWGHAALWTGLSLLSGFDALQPGLGCVGLSLKSIRTALQTLLVARRSAARAEGGPCNVSLDAGVPSSARRPSFHQDYIAVSAPSFTPNMLQEDDMKAHLQVLIDGKEVDRLSRDGPRNVSLDAATPSSGTAAKQDKEVKLDIIVEAVFRSNEGWRFDTKGLASPHVQLNGERHSACSSTDMT